MVCAVCGAAGGPGRSQMLAGAVRVLGVSMLWCVGQWTGYIGRIASALGVADAVDFAGQRVVQVRRTCQFCQVLQQVVCCVGQ